MVLEVFQPSGGAGGGEVEGVGFVIQLAADHGSPDDAGEFVRSSYDTFGFAKPPFEPPPVIAHFAVGRADGLQDKGKGPLSPLLGHASVETTMIYLHLLKRPGAGARHPALPGQPCDPAVLVLLCALAQRLEFNETDEGG